MLINHHLLRAWQKILREGWFCGSCPHCRHDAPLVRELPYTRQCEVSDPRDCPGLKDWRADRPQAGRPQQANP